MNDPALSLALPANPPAIPTSVEAVLRPGERVVALPWAVRYVITDLGRLISFIRGTVTVLGDNLQSRDYVQNTVYTDERVGGKRVVRRYLRHVLVAWFFRAEERPEGYDLHDPSKVFDVHHRNADKLDNRAVNLEYVPKRRNSQFAVLHGNNKNLKLDASAVFEARARVRTEPRAGVVAWLVDAYDVTPRWAADVIRGQAWTCVPQPDEPLTVEELAERICVPADEAARLLDLAAGVRCRAA